MYKEIKPAGGLLIRRLCSMKVVKNVCIYIGLIEPLVKLRLQRIVSGFFSTDLHQSSAALAEDFAVSHIACKSGLLNGINDFFLPFLRRYDDLEFDFRLKYNIDFGTPDDFFISSLDAASHYLRYGDTVDLYLVEGVFDILEHFFSYDCFYFD